MPTKHGVPYGDWMINNSLERPPLGADATGVSVAITVSGLVKRYGARTVLDGVTFTVPSGAITGFVGPNGAGKTTTIRTLLGFVDRSAGSADVLGHSIDDPASFLSHVGALIDSPAFYPALSARQNLRLLADVGGIATARIDVVLDIVGLTARADDAKRYSLGMRQRLGIAAALLPDPTLLVLDEPTNGLDPVGIQEIRNLLRRLADEGRTVLVSSHLLSELEHVSDWLVVLDGGRVVYEGTVAALSGGTHDLIVSTQHPDDLSVIELLCAERHFGASRSTNHRLVIDAPASFAVELNRAAMDLGVVLAELSPRQASLEESFLALIGGTR